MKAGKDWSLVSVLACDSSNRRDFPSFFPEEIYLYKVKIEVAYTRY